MKYTPIFVEKLPMINASDRFIIIENAHTTLTADWIEFSKKIVNIALTKKGVFKMLRSRIKGETSLFSLDNRVKEILCLSGEYAVVDIDIDTTKESSSIKQLMVYEDLIRYFISDPKPPIRIYDASLRAIIDRFFALSME